MCAFISSEHHSFTPEEISAQRVEAREREVHVDDVDEKRRIFTPSLY
jgi:hypothetical protein